MLWPAFSPFPTALEKEKNTHYQHFLLFPQCFPDFFLKPVKSLDCVVKSYLNKSQEDVSKRRNILWKENSIIFPMTRKHFGTRSQPYSQNNAPFPIMFPDIVEKGENVGNQHFLLLPIMFSTLSKKSCTV